MGAGRAGSRCSSWARGGAARGSCDAQRSLGEACILLRRHAAEAAEARHREREGAGERQRPGWERRRGAARAAALLRTACRVAAAAGPPCRRVGVAPAWPPPNGRRCGAREAGGERREAGEGVHSRGGGLVDRSRASRGGWNNSNGSPGPPRKDRAPKAHPLALLAPQRLPPSCPPLPLWVLGHTDQTILSALAGRWARLFSKPPPAAVIWAPPGEPPNRLVPLPADSQPVCAAWCAGPRSRRRAAPATA